MANLKKISETKTNKPNTLAMRGRYYGKKSGKSNNSDLFKNSRGEWVQKYDDDGIPNTEWLDRIQAKKKTKKKTATT